MGVFTVNIKTPTREKPATRSADVNERAAIQRALLQVVSAVSNNGSYEGTIDHPAARGNFSYEVTNV